MICSWLSHTGFTFILNSSPPCLKAAVFPMVQLFEKACNKAQRTGNVQHLNVLFKMLQVRHNEYIAGKWC